MREPDFFSSPEPPPRRRLVEKSSHTSSPSTRASVTSVNWRPFGWSSGGVARTVRSSGSPTAIGRCCTIRFSMCTSPTAGNGKSPAVISSMCSGKARMCGYVAGSVSARRNPHTRAYLASASGSTCTPSSRSTVSGIGPPPPPTNGQPRRAGDQRRGRACVGADHVRPPAGSGRTRGPCCRSGRWRRGRRTRRSSRPRPPAARPATGWTCAGRPRAPAPASPASSGSR